MPPKKTQEDHLAATIRSIGQAAFPSHLADWLGCDIAYDNIAMLAYFQDRKPELLNIQSKNPDVSQNIKTQYLMGNYLLDPFHELHVSTAPRGVYRLRDIAPDRFLQNKYFIDYYSSTRMVDELAFITYPTKGVSVHICLGRDSSSNAKFSALMVKAAGKIATIVSAMAEAHWSTLETSGVYAGDHTSDHLAEALHKHTDIRLTHRQSEVAMLMLRCHSSEAIGLKLGISPQTVRVFRKQIYKRCQISSLGELFNLLLPMLNSP